MSSYLNALRRKNQVKIIAFPIRLSWNKSVEVKVFSKNKAVKTCFESLSKSRNHQVKIFDPEELEPFLKRIRLPMIVYVDVSALDETRRTGFLQSIARRTKIRFGVADPLGQIDDIGQLFHSGAIDYLGKKTLALPFSPKRIEAALRLKPFVEQSGEAESETSANQMWNLSGNDWSEIKSGKEYAFCFMFVEIDLLDEWKRKSGREHLDGVKTAFHSHIERTIAPVNGKIWMWMDTGGLVLFPFDGKECDAIVTCLKLVLDRVLLSAEQFSYGTIISYRIALHIGNTLYKARGNTGTIVSGDVNFLFHLGQKFAEPGNFYLTDPVTRFIPKGMESNFIKMGSFENVEITRMRLPQY
jgi:hypothetical protein